MIKIKVFDISLTVMAFAALIFLLPPDKETAAIGGGVQDTKSQFHNDSKAAHHSPSRMDISRIT